MHSPRVNAVDFVFDHRFGQTENYAQIALAARSLSKHQYGQRLVGSEPG